LPKPKIAIIGGGPAGLSTAFHLTNDPNWRDRINSITVYQMGWRLGGKGATGRDANRGWRLEEHGIHGFCRFYFNTFRMMERAYAELSQDNRRRLPVREMQDAFLGSSLSLGVEHVGDKWSMRSSHLPHFPGVPWSTGAFDDPGPLEIGRRILEQMLRRGRRGPLASLDAKDLVPVDDEAALAAAAAIDRALRDALAAAALATGVLDTVVRVLLESWIVLLGQITPAFGSLFASAIESAGRTGDVGAYGALTSLDLYTALLRGLIVDGILVPGHDLDDFDGEDYRDWLGRHHASPETLKSSSVFTIANMLFAYPGGDSRRDPALSAASWLGWILRTLSGRGEYFYLMAAGTGETVILPLYLLLKQRGVRFEFFHRLTHVESAKSADELVVESLTFERQARPNEAEYDPIDQPRSLRFGVWPNQPLLDRLSNGKQDRDYEAWDDGRHEETFSITRGDGFDHVVWAIPPSMIPLVGDDALKRRWQPVIDRLPTTATQAAQIWLRKPTVDLGPRCNYPERYASASFPNPLNGMVSFDDVLCFEGWGAPGPLGLFYLCGALAPVQPPTEATRAAERKRVRVSVLNTLNLIGNFFPAAALPPHTDPSHPKQINFEILFPLPGSGNSGAQRILDQYVRVNTRPTEAYVQAPKESVRGRLDPWNSGYANLIPAGDWICTGINVGAFESAVTGGKLAAFALTGVPAVGDIEAYAFFHPRAAERAAEAVRTGRVPRIR